MIPPILVVAGLAALGGGWLALRRVGPGVRLGRLLAATQKVPVGRARELAQGGVARYVAVRGRIDASDEFEDEHHRPLVFRRRRLEVRGPSGWTSVEDVREVVPFEIAEGLDSIAVDGDGLDEGLVVVTREASGTAVEIPDRLPAGTPPAAPVRYRVEQVSSVEHAIALGVPTLDPQRGPILRSGLGRPLILTTLEPPEAMRLLAYGRRRATRAATLLLGVGLMLLAVGAVAWIVDALA